MVSVKAVVRLRSGVVPLPGPTTTLDNETIVRAAKHEAGVPYGC